MHHCIECLAPYCIDIPLLVLFLYLCVEDVDEQGSKCNVMLYLKFEVDARTHMIDCVTHFKSQCCCIHNLETDPVYIQYAL